MGTASCKFMGDNMTKKLKKRLKRILIGAGLFILAVLIGKFIPVLGNFVLIFYLLAYAVVGGDVVKKAVTNITRGQIFDENFLMLIATVGAFFVGEYPEAVAVMLFYQVGEWFQSFAVNNSRKSIKELMNIRPDYAVVLRQGEEVEVDPDEVAIGEIILIKPGERVPLDGKVVKGNCSLDTMALTGESVPRDVVTGDEVISGCINLNSVIEVEVTKEFAQSTVTKILDLVENASSQKAVTEQFITRFARYYTPVVVILAAMLAIIPSLVVGNFSTWLYRALSFLVISCPCALVISVPLSFFGGIGGASKAGILIKGSNYLEILAQAETVVMDKTGTLTKGSFEVSEVVCRSKVLSAKSQKMASNDNALLEEEMENNCEDGILSKEKLLEYAAYAECYSNHPISKSLQRAYGKEIRKEEISNAEEKAGMGVITKWKETTIYAGNEKLMKWLAENKDILVAEKTGKKMVLNNATDASLIKSLFHVDKAGTICHIAVEENLKVEYLGYIVIADEIKEDAKTAIEGLKDAGIKRIVMLTGDALKTAETVAETLGIKEYHAELLPGDKVELTEKLLLEKQENRKLIFVGDGMNDAPVLARADIGIAMGGLGSDAAIEAADIVIMNDQPSKIATAMKISRKTLKIVKQNIVFAIGIKVVVLIMAALGMASMWAAVFADVGVAFLAILNAMRAMKVK